MKLLPFTKLNHPKIIKLASTFPRVGYLEVSADNLAYLDVEDTYVHELFPLLKLKGVYKPDYFGTNPIGAHISVIYPEENIVLREEDLHQEHFFKIIGNYTAEHNSKKYFVLGIESPTLSLLRHKYGLSDKPCFKNHGVDFHITYAISYL